MRGRSASEVAATAQLACLLEVSAPKPGNVSPGHHFADLRYEDFLAAAAALGEPLSMAGERPLGQVIRSAVETTSRWTSSNANLGIVLLLAPLVQAALRPQEPGGLREAVGEVLGTTTVEDARDTYAAIRRAEPGGLGAADAQDVAGDPDVSLLEAMCLARDRDDIAREYATRYEITFGLAAPALHRARRDGLDWEDAVVETYLTVLAQRPDTHIVRRAGRELAERVSARAVQALQAGGVRLPAGREAIAAMDRALRGPANRANPGTSADLTCAAIFVALLSGDGRASLK